jgi:hypothetical protein
MRIKFDDEAISTFEYPSEASLLIDDTPPAEDAPSQPRGLQALPSGILQKRLKFTVYIVVFVLVTIFHRMAVFKRELRNMSS